MRRLNPKAFNSFLNQIGQRFAYRTSAACPCVDRTTGAPRHDCAQCDGLGWIWDEPVTGISGIASQKIQRQWADFGIWEPGDTVLTIPSDSPLYAMGSYDRVVMLDSTEAFRVTRRRGIDDLRVFPVASIDRMFWLDANEAVVEAIVPTIASDFVLTFNPTPGNLPAGQQYSMSGRRHPEFFMFQDLAQDRSHHLGEDLPRRVVLRKFDLFGRSLNDG
jgi:hypothetical protein